MKEMASTFLWFLTIWLCANALEIPEQSMSEVLSRIVDELGELRKQNSAMEGEINKLKEHDVYQSDRIAALEAREKELAKEVEQLKSRIDNTGKHETDNQDAAFHIKEIGEEVNEGKSDMAERGQDTYDVKDTDKSQNRIRQVTQEAPIAFFATASSHLEHLGVNQPVMFDTVHTNVGQAYRSSTGVFTAPLPGIYVFSATIFGYTEDAHFQFAVNGQFKTQMYVHKADTYETTSQTVIFELKQGDDVVIRSVDADKMVHGGHFSSLSGFLLSPTTMTAQDIG